MSARRAEGKLSGKMGLAFSVSVLNQMVSSGTNFVFGLYLVRALSLSDFGLYGIGYAISMYYAGIGNALFLTQMVVHAPEKPLNERLPYAARTLVLVVIFCTVTIFIATLLLLAAGLWWAPMFKYVHWGLAVVAASAAYLIKEFFVRHAFSNRREDWALSLNLGAAIAMVLLVASQEFWRYSFTVETAVWIYAIAQIVAVIVGFRLTRLPLHGISQTDLISDLRLGWVGGRWALGGVSVTWLQSQAYMYVTAVFIGSSGVGYANAGRLLIAPVLFLVPAFNQIALPRLSSLRVKDRPELIRSGKIYTFGMVGVAVLYLFILSISFDMVMPLILGKHYPNIGQIVGMWCVVLIAQLMRDGASTSLQALKEFRVLMVANLFSAIMAVSSALILSWSLGVPGAILGTAVGELTLAYLLWKRLIGNA